MTVTLGQVEAAQPERLTEAADRTGASARAVRRQVDAQQGAVGKLHANWTGTAADAATGRALKLLAGQLQLHTALTILQSVMQSGGDELTDIRATLMQRANVLRAIGWQIGDDGTVSIRPGSRLEQLAKSSARNEMVLKRMAASHSVDLKALLVEFETQDAATAAAMHKAIEGVGLDQTTGPPPGLEDPVPGANEQPGDPGYEVPHAPGDPADHTPSGWETDAQGMVNPPGCPPEPPGPQRDANWMAYLSGRNADGTTRPYGEAPAAYPLPQAVSDKRLKIIGAALNQQGTRYVWGGGNAQGTTHGDGLPYSGFDCSGLTEYAIYQATGYDPGHYTGTQFQNLTTGANPFGTVVQTGPSLDPNNLQPGDIIYTDAGGAVAGQHVEIYLGNGVTVETSTDGTPVHTERANMSSPSGNMRVVRPN